MIRPQSTTYANLAINGRRPVPNGPRVAAGSMSVEQSRQVGSGHRQVIINSGTVTAVVFEQCRHWCLQRTPGGLGSWGVGVGAE